MQDHKELLSIQIVFGAVFLMLAGFIALNLLEILQWNQSTINALLFAFVAVFLLKDGLPNFILGLKDYLKREPKPEKKSNILED
jgi:hypothetical protein